MTSKDKRIASRLKAIFYKQGDYPINATGKYATSVLSWAAQSKYPETVQYLLSKRKIDVNSKNNDGLTPLHIATLFVHLEIVELLLSQRDIMADAKDDEGDTPLMLAARVGHTATMKLLMDRKDANKNHRNECGHTALIYAARASEEKIMEILLAYEDIQINAQDDVGVTAVITDHTEIIRLLIEKGADFTLADRYGSTPVVYAAIYKHPEAVKLLYSAEVNAKMAPEEPLAYLHRIQSTMPDGLRRFHGLDGFDMEALKPFWAEDWLPGRHTGVNTLSYGF